MDAKKILIAAIYRDQQEFNQYVNIFSKMNFYVPPPFWDSVLKLGW